jgi:hypothetical protein
MNYVGQDIKRWVGKTRFDVLDMSMPSVALNG